jgi:hypothetical protein
MPVAPFVPLIASGISAGAGLIAGRPKGPGGDEKAALGEQLAGARQAREQGGQLFSFGMPLLQRSSNYYDTILRGNRSAIQAQMAPEIAGINDVYRGAGRSLERSGIRGAGRDVAEAELSRQKAGQLGGMVLAQRPAAAAAVGDLGRFGASAGQAGIQGAGGLYGQLTAGMRANREFGAQQSQQYGQAVGGFISDLLRQIPWNRSGGGGSIPPFYWPM